MLRSLIAYDANGEVVATLGHMVARDEDGNVTGLVDFEAHENAGGRMRDIWVKRSAVGSATWPEWIGAAIYDFRVELDPDPSPVRARISALVHKKSGHRRERAAIEVEIERRHEQARAEVAARKSPGWKAAVNRIRGIEVDERPVVDLRDLLGGPGKPILLDEDGKTRARPKAKPVNLPVVKRSRG